MYLLVLTLTTLISLSNSLNILLLFTHIGKSHYLVFEPMVEELASRGHNVTLIVNFNTKQSNLYRVINIADENNMLNSNKTEILSMDIFLKSRLALYSTHHRLRNYSIFSCERLASGKLLKFLEENNKFDVIVSEVFGTNCFSGLSTLINAPIVGVSSTDIMPWSSQWFGVPENPSYIPTVFSDFHDRMTFRQRLENTLMLTWSKFIHKYYIQDLDSYYFKKYLNHDLNQQQTISNMSLLLLNRHFTYQSHRPFTANVVEVGGIHIRAPKALPTNFKKIVDNSEDGVILISMGSTLKGTSFPDKQRKIFLKEFSKLPHTIIWKWENETMSDLPSNVILYRWVPQLDLLCHPNVKLFITQGGVLSTEEALYCGVPMLVLPQFGDQFYNAAALSRIGISVTKKLHTMTSDGLEEALDSLLSEEKYELAKVLSERFKDRPMSPMDTAIYWIEYVARHKGAHFLRPPVADMPFYQYLLLDVLAFISAILFIVSFVLYKLFKYIIKLFMKSKRKIKTN